jgi:translation initiation factor 2 subunit 2
VKEASLAHRKQRKSVAFSEGAIVMDENGEIREVSHPEGTTAEKHSSGRFLILSFGSP